MARSTNRYNRKKQRLAELRERRKRYIKREEVMLSEQGIFNYGVGSRNVTRYNTDLKAIQDAIKRLDEEITDLENQLDGRSPRKAVGVVPRDDW